MRNVELSPITVADVRERVELWRRTRKRQTAMPEELWLVAVEVARRAGVSQVARVAGLDYDRLKQRMLAQRLSSRGAAGFVEVALDGADARSTIGECVVELERPDGTRMRILGASQRSLVRCTAAFVRGRS